MKVELKNKIVFGLWIVAALSVMTLFVAAMYKRNNGLCNGVNVEIANADGSFFVSKNEVIKSVNEIFVVEQTPVKAISTNAIEKRLLKNEWIKNAEVFFDNKGMLNIDITQRKPIARFFTLYNTNYYIDETSLRMPSNRNATARVLIVTGFPSDNKILSHSDSSLLMVVSKLCNYIYKDSFLNAQIAQINVTNTGRFEFVPSVGNHIVEFGDAKDYQEKFKRLYTFYTKAWLQNGLDSYEKIDVRFNNQVVATRVGASAMDSSFVNQFADSSAVVADTLLH